MQQAVNLIFLVRIERLRVFAACGALLKKRRWRQESDLSTAGPLLQTVRFNKFFASAGLHLPL